ncbi:MAG TPA: phage tail protein [Cytophagaceae bacterium]|jgi:phage tail-like protein|nr:phage tail protein [Cytophagaceae bacterium]
MAQYKYPPVGFHFKVQFEGLSGLTDNDTRFMEVGGLNVSIKTDPYQEGGENRFSWALPTGVQYETLKLRRGLIVDSGINNWVRDAVSNFSFKPVNLMVTLLNPDHQPLQSWHVVGAYPVNWKTSEFKAMASEIVTEELELYYQYFKNI